MKTLDLKERSPHLSSTERRSMAIEAVIALAACQNPSEITTTTIAHSMGLTQGALFRHFSTKDKLLESVMKWVSKTLIERIDHAAHEKSSPIMALRSIFLSHVDFVCRYPGIPRLLFSELQRPDESIIKQTVLLLMTRYHERLRFHLEEGKSKEYLDADLDIKAAAIAFIGMIQGLIIRSLLSGDMESIRQEAPKIFTIYLRGLGAKE